VIRGPLDVCGNPPDDPLVISEEKTIKQFYHTYITNINGNINQDCQKSYEENTRPCSQET
jgi:hypothetical protein